MVKTSSSIAVCTASFHLIVYLLYKTEQDKDYYSVFLDEGLKP